MRRFLTVIFSSALLLGGAAIADDVAPLAAQNVLERRRGAAFHFEGRLGEYLQAITENWLLRAPDDNPAMLGMFADRDRPPYRDLLPWSGEFAGKYLTSATQVLRLTGDERLRAYVQKFVDRLIALQDADGYLGPFPKDSRLTGKAPNCKGGTWDAWGHYHVMLGLLLWHDLARDEKALHGAERIGDLLCDQFLGDKRRIVDMGSPDQNQAVVHGLCLLYERTGRKRYLELAEQVVAEFEAPGAGDYVRTALAGKEFYATPKPRWESLHAIQALPELYRITGDDKYRRAFERIWWSIAQFDRHNNGGFSSAEQAVGDPYDPRPIETCCTIAWLAMSEQMLRLGGRSIIADELELSTLNQVYGLQDRSGRWCTYNTPMDGRRVPSAIDIAFQKRPGSEELSCCSVNAARGFGIVGDWALLLDPHDRGLVLNWYGPSKLSATVAGGTRVTLTQLTDYPRTGRIKIRVDADKPARFALKLRVPHWSDRTIIRVNGGEVLENVKPGTYRPIEREWRPADEVEIELDMALGYWAGERRLAGKVSLYRGPLLLAYEPGAGSSTKTSTRTTSAGGDLPMLDVGHLAPALLGDAGAGGPIVQLNVTGVDGEQRLLIDYASAGRDGRAYATWLPARGDVAPAAFSRENPTRTIRCKQ